MVSLRPQCKALNTIRVRYAGQADRTCSWVVLFCLSCQHIHLGCVCVLSSVPGLWRWWAHSQGISPPDGGEGKVAKLRPLLMKHETLTSLEDPSYVERDQRVWSEGPGFAQMWIVHLTLYNKTHWGCSWFLSFDLFTSLQHTSAESPVHGIGSA